VSRADDAIVSQRVFHFLAFDKALPNVDLQTYAHHPENLAATQSPPICAELGW
jgi:hypothetical protein